MGDNRKSVIVWIALAATAVQQFAVNYGPSPGLPTNQAYYLMLLFVAVPFNVGAIVLFARRDRPDLTVAAVAGLSLAWHVYALVHLPGLSWTVSVVYQVGQVAVFGFVVLVSITVHARQPVRSRRPARMRAPEPPGT